MIYRIIKIFGLSDKLEKPSRKREVAGINTNRRSIRTGRSQLKAGSITDYKNYRL